MRVLLLHPEDSPRRGLWSTQRWDLIVDLGRSSTFSTAGWETQARCPVLRSDWFRRGIEDLRLLRGMFAAGRGHLLDEEGIDWWDLVSLLIAQETEAMLVLRRLAAEISPGAELWATRSGWPASVIAATLGRPIHAFSSNSLARVAGWAVRYAKLFRRFSAAQIKEIFLDKYDSDYAWRSPFSPTPPGSAEPVILIPSAYGNVSRMAVSYARMLPEQPALLVATRQSAKQFEPQANVRVQDLAAYASTDRPMREIASIHEKWGRLRSELCTDREFDVLSRAGIFHRFAQWFHDGLCARNAWRTVLEREPVCGVLCGDDSNIYTRLPVLLAAKRKLPTVDFHHGAMDGRCLLKDLPCDVYLAKNEMERDYLLRVCGLPAERVLIGAPLPMHSSASEYDQSGRNSVILFSEPYENAGMRAEEVYRELLPPLCRLARETGRAVIIKLHPFESSSERNRMLRALLPPEDYKLIRVLEGPLSKRMLSQAWFGVTIESTTVTDCLFNGIPCFLCGWLTLSPFEYVQQYARFGIGDVLQNVNEIAEIPRRLAQFDKSASKQQNLWKMVEPETLRHLLTNVPAVSYPRR